MSRKKGRRPLVPGAEDGLNRLKTEAMRQEGYAVNPARPDDVKYEVAQSLGVPLRPGQGGRLTTEEAGHVGGRIGGAMMSRMIRMAQEQLAKRPPT
ncbi:MAG TPA: alpha/beta-type small acid-soluble spore protein [Paenibacillus sp.]|uniref:alpha/beta-type small acid-soluble spore protein n=1 Tax=Paenibacillus sp. TaxID=58172 RepID=UPI0028D88D57|nr:alpha/beta-type small acid-soluble spore protein [Paenibacillus sp.]HUC91153.1 alpha/beta-type small acid-soluble spore protein [Paenibacillus sp.]